MLRGQLGAAGRVFVPRRAWTALTDLSSGLLLYFKIKIHLRGLERVNKTLRTTWDKSQTKGNG